MCGDCSARYAERVGCSAAELDPLIVWAERFYTSPTGATVPDRGAVVIPRMADRLLGMATEARGLSRGLEFNG